MVVSRAWGVEEMRRWWAKGTDFQLEDEEVLGGQMRSMVIIVQ